LERTFGLGWSDYGARWYDAAIGRFSTIDRFAENYADMNPYQYAANNPIKFIDVNGDSIKTYIYNEKGVQVNEIPQQIINAFANEYGIVLGYNSATNMLYKAGDTEAKQYVDSGAKKEIESVLGAENAKDALAFGYDMYRILYKKEEPVQYGTYDSRGAKVDAGVAFIDLADFNTNGSMKAVTTNKEFEPRSSNLMRTIEHEFWGHGKYGGQGGRSSEYDFNIKELNKKFNKPMGIPEGTNYCDIDKKTKKLFASFSNGGILYYENSKSIDQKRKLLDYKSLIPKQNRK
jgi:RHS repeat-associated protein